MKSMRVPVWYQPVGYTGHHSALITIALSGSPTGRPAGPDVSATSRPCFTLALSTG